MADESFLLVSLDEEKSKQLAQVLSNDTARKILDIMSKKEMMTETEIAEKLKIPLSTVHYNMALLVKSDLVKDEHYKYSEKGKKIIHYSLSNKYVVIAPKKSAGIASRLKEFLPVVFIMGAASLAVQFLSSQNNPAPAALKTEMLAAEADMAAAAIQSGPNYALWFLAGSIMALLVYFVWTRIALKTK
ncbi:TPA: helix-turn-helix transcriptional regulator [Candidatus Woesearchaeota archaeon]|nr:helix-turn-helix transcriptional regulator [Candidatus Woesearchaeota archaeon]